LIVTVSERPDRFHAPPVSGGATITGIGVSTSSAMSLNQPLIWLKSASQASITAFVRAGSMPVATSESSYWNL